MQDLITSARPTLAAEPRAAAQCGDRLLPVPPDTDNDGWTCARPEGHLPGQDHRAEDGTTW